MLLLHEDHDPLNSDSLAGVLQEACYTRVYPEARPRSEEYYMGGAVATATVGRGT